MNSNSPAAMLAEPTTSFAVNRVAARCLKVVSS